MTTEPEDWDIIERRLNGELRRRLAAMTHAEARFLVDAYYQQQEHRIAMRGQERAIDQGADETAPETAVSWFGDVTERFEGQIKAILGEWASSFPEGRWAQSITGIGPVLAAGLLAHIDIDKARTAGHIWRFAGLDPSVKWEPKTKRPWNAKLKVLTWKIGESFVKVQNRENDFYGHRFATYKAALIERNEAGEFADTAAAILESKKYRGETVAKAAYEAGKLPPAHIHARARRWTVKLFLSHYQHVAWEYKHGECPPAPYVITHGGHVDYIPPPNFVCR